jgi:exodeoxyribonuclease-3
LSGAITSHRIDVDLRDWQKASDHVPVMATFEI